MDRYGRRLKQIINLGTKFEIGRYLKLSLQFTSLFYYYIFQRITCLLSIEKY